MFKIIKKNLFLLSIFINILNSGLNENNKNKKLDLSTLKRKNFIDNELNELNELNEIEETKKYIIISPKKIPKENNLTPEKENTIDLSIKLFIRNDIKNINKKSLNYIQKLMETPNPKKKINF